MTGTERHDEVAERLAAVRARVAEACEQSGRDPAEITLTVVTKFFPASDVRLLAELGVTDVGENRHQEALEKVTSCAGVPVRWHYIGGLQSNKAAAVAAYAQVVESVDRAKLVAPLARGAREADRPQPLDCLVQVSLDPPGERASRSGVDPKDLGALTDLVAGAEGLRLAGLMAVAPLGEDPDTAFARLARIHDDVRARHPAATWLSAGMSGDLEQAIAHGATHVRVGRAVLGPRPPIK
ncbi:YggS family pyridoxal phosphate-dependent enzyme [Nocardioides sp.]|uniref:YggS family pyridoxal phosphate-dependent enzyme n=1 Tax=Nocardioides sp. TaxID=35761 RepID=UPI002733CC3A|nr:YggS family pyridoxal phosphate-dependent enzyme [Nocardioides sp.]MDP3892626.1 YggS family pyridoxal phosphate-dependent enzyme [Nocardioides sp.]